MIVVYSNRLLDSKRNRDGLTAGGVKIQQMYENLDLDLNLKLLFMVTGAHYDSGLF